MIYRDKVVIVVELLDGREVSVLLNLEWRLRIRASPEKGGGQFVLKNAPKDIFGQLTHLCRSFLPQFDDSQDVAHPLILNVAHPLIGNTFRLFF